MKQTRQLVRALSSLYYLDVYDSYLEMSGGQRSNLYLNGVHFFNTSNDTQMQSDATSNLNFGSKTVFFSEIFVYIFSTGLLRGVKTWMTATRHLHPILIAVCGITNKPWNPGAVS